MVVHPGGQVGDEVLVPGEDQHGGGQSVAGPEEGAVLARVGLTELPSVAGTLAQGGELVAVLRPCLVDEARPAALPGLAVGGEVLPAPLVAVPVPVSVSGPA